MLYMVIAEKLMMKPYADFVYQSSRQITLFVSNNSNWSITFPFRVIDFGIYYLHDEFSIAEVVQQIAAFMNFA